MNAFRGAIAPVQDLRACGVNVGLGIDNYFSDYFDVMRSCIAVARIRAHDPEVMPANEVLELATLNAARALGLDTITGSLEVGKRADLQIVDMRRYGLTPTNDALRTLVYHAHAKDVETVMVDGRMVVLEGRVVGEDEQALLDALILKYRQHHLEHRPAHALPPKIGDHARPGIINRLFAIP